MIVRTTRLLLTALVLIAGLSTVALAAQSPDRSAIEAALTRPILAPGQVIEELQAYIEPRIPGPPAPLEPGEWTNYADRLRREILETAVFRGEAAAWRDARCRVEWLDSMAGGPGYSLQTLRYEAIPGLWIPAILYVPDRLVEKVPVVLNVNGHDANGKAADYKQLRCINLAKRGILALNVEWIGMGQLRTDGFQHGLINAIDLCGTSGVAVHFLAMSRALDLLLAHPHADPKRVAVTGLSGGGWQTIFFSALEPRVTLANPVAGYSSFRTRNRYFSDLGDSEQTPTDLATVADYTHLTALLAPRPALLTFNRKDQCCFASPHALPPLLDAAGPVYRRLGRPDHLRWHVNDDPGTHNYLVDNRQAFYRMLAAFFAPGDPGFDVVEIASEGEVRSKEALNVPLPDDNLDLHQIAVRLSRPLPKEAAPPDRPEDRPAWLAGRRERLARIVRSRPQDAEPRRLGVERSRSMTATLWTFRVGESWTVPAVELQRVGARAATVLLIADGGRTATAATAEQVLLDGKAALAVDPFYFGESRPPERDYLWALMLSTLGDRPLGLQTDQLRAIARRVRDQTQAPVELLAEGPRVATLALVAAALEPELFARVEVRGAPSSLKDWIDSRRIYNAAPEQFCFGLLERFDLDGLRAMAPERVRIAEAKPRPSPSPPIVSRPRGPSAAAAAHADALADAPRD